MILGADRQKFIVNSAQQYETVANSLQRSQNGEIEVINLKPVIAADVKSVEV